MRERSHMITMLTMAAAMALVHEIKDAPQPIKPKLKTTERLTKAEKKRARKAARVIRLSQGKSEVQK